MPKERIVRPEEMEEILARAKVARLATSWQGQPYVVPVFFVYHKGIVYIHSSRQGRKIENLRANPYVCLEVDRLHGLTPGATACNFSARYESVLAFGRASLLEDTLEKAEALNLLVEKYAQGYPFPPLTTADLEEWPHLAVIKIEVEELSGRRNLD